MPWSEIVLLIAASALLDVPVMGFTLYWIAQFLELRLEQRKRWISDSEAEEMRQQLARIQAQLDQSRNDNAPSAAWRSGWISSSGSCADAKCPHSPAGGVRTPELIDRPPTKLLSSPRREWWHG